MHTQQKASHKEGLEGVRLKPAQYQMASLSRWRSLREKPKAAPAPRRGSGPGTSGGGVTSTAFTVEVTDWITPFVTVSVEVKVSLVKT